MLLNKDHQSQLRELAWQSIRYGLAHHHAQLPVDQYQYADELQALLSSFVTLHKSDVLRGCIGSLEATCSLVEDVGLHANAAAFSDPRFPALSANEVDDISLSISVLSAPQSMDIRDEEDLLKQLRPGIDGLILNSHKHRATFLPAVWEQLPNAKQFLAELKQKANLAPSYWSADIQFQRYTTQMF